MKMLTIEITERDAEMLISALEEAITADQDALKRARPITDDEGLRRDIAAQHSLRKAIQITLHMSRMEKKK